MAETSKIDMRVRIREKCDLATIYADDGAYHSAARVLRELAEEVQRHADRVHTAPQDGRVA